MTANSKWHSFPKGMGVLFTKTHEVKQGLRVPKTEAAKPRKNLMENPGDGKQRRGQFG